jgi:hypothetical protein
MKLVVITQDGCNPCEEVRQRIKPFLDDGNIQELNISNNDEAVLIADKAGIDRFPSFLLVTDKGEPFAEVDVFPPEDLAHE